MPELPEVETVRRKLKPRLINKKILSVDVYWPNMIVDIPVIEFQKKLVDQVFIDVKRRGKWLVFELTDYYLLVHLRMEGKFFFRKRSEEKSKHEHVVFKLKDEDLRFQDVRKFGKMYLLNKDEINTRKPLSELGLEPDDEMLTASCLRVKCKNKSISIKEVLLDQSIIVGIGNIYADEILFLSKINPWRKARALSINEYKKIIDNTREILTKATLLGGTTIRSYESLDNEKGSYQEELYVHSRKDMPCKVCDDKVKKDFLGGRGTYYCSTCQNVKK